MLCSFIVVFLLLCSFDVMLLCCCFCVLLLCCCCSFVLFSCIVRFMQGRLATDSLSALLLGALGKQGVACTVYKCFISC